MSTGIKVTVVLDGLVRKLERAQERQAAYAKRAKFLMDKYTPLDTGALRGSADVSSRFEHGQIVYTMPYSAKHYYVPMRHTQPGTTDHWDRAMLAADGDGLREFARRLFD